jgi:ankyrin repeat protein
MIYESKIYDALGADDLDYVMKNLSPKDINDSDVAVSPLYLAMQSPTLKVARYLLNNGALVNLQVRNGWTALHYAAHHGNIPGINLLICAGCDINLRNIYGMTALFTAMESGHLALAKLLIDHGGIYKTNDPATTTIANIIPERYQQPVIKFIAKRNGLRSSIIAFIGLRARRVRCFGPNGRDVCTLIMKHVWSMRFGL